MADSKIVDLTENTSPLVTDLLVMVDDPSGTPADQKIKIENLLRTAMDGWMNPVQTWTRESDNSFSEPIDATLKYKKGDKIKYKQGGAYKYQYIIGIGAYTAGKTIMTTTGGTDHIFTNGVSITDNYYSHQENPIGFPEYFNELGTFNTNSLDNGSGGTITAASKFIIYGSECINYVTVGASVKVNTDSIIRFIKPTTLPTLVNGEGWGITSGNIPLIMKENYILITTVVITDDSAIGTINFTYKYIY